MIEAFKLTKFYVSVGICTVSDCCAVYVDTIAPPTTRMFQPPNDRKYIIDAVFEFQAPKKAAFTSIINALRRNDIYPYDREDCFLPQTNPDNKFYTRLPKSKFELIIKIIEIIGSSLDLVVSEGAITTGCTLTRVDPSTLQDLIRQHQPQIPLTRPGVLVLGQKSTLMHAFPENFHANVKPVPRVRAQPVQDY